MCGSSSLSTASVRGVMSVKGMNKKGEWMQETLCVTLDAKLLDFLRKNSDRNNVIKCVLTGCQSPVNDADSARPHITLTSYGGYGALREYFKFIVILRLVAACPSDHGLSVVSVQHHTQKKS